MLPIRPVRPHSILKHRRVPVRDQPPRKPKIRSGRRVPQLLPVSPVERDLLHPRRRIPVNQFVVRRVPEILRPARNLRRRFHPVRLVVRERRPHPHQHIPIQIVIRIRQLIRRRIHRNRRRCPVQHLRRQIPEPIKSTAPHCHKRNSASAWSNPAASKPP